MRSQSTRHKYRNSAGSILPFVALAMTFVVAYLGFSMDVMRTVYATQTLSFAARSAAMSAYSFAVDQNGNYLGNPLTSGAAAQNIIDQVTSTGGVTGNPWNSGPAGPGPSQAAQTAIRFSSGDVRFVPNPQDPSDFYLDVEARRDGNDALNMFFLPAIYAFSAMSGGSIPPSAYQANPRRVAEVVAEPASRIGQGPPKTDNRTRAQQLMGFATFPVAINLTDFKAIQSLAPGRSCFLTLTAPGASVTWQSPAPAGAAATVRAYLVDVAPGSVGSPYGSAQGLNAASDLQGTLNYFLPVQQSLDTPPAAVERGSAVTAFDAAALSATASSWTKVQPALQNLSTQRANHSFILPVVHQDPGNSTSYIVDGFAWMTLQRLVDPSDPSKFQIVFNTSESVPIRNASFANGTRTVSLNGADLLSLASQMPAPDPVFDQRFDPLANQMQKKPLSVAMAPALSPYNVVPWQ